MNSFTAITSRLFSRVFRQANDIEFTSDPCEVEPLTAVAIVESKFVRAATFCGQLPNEIRKEVFSETAEDEEALTELHSAHHSPNPRIAFGSAMGLTIAGKRATVFLTGSELIACQDLLLECVKQHLPIVIHVVLCDHAMASTYDAYHYSSMSGAMQFLATNSQEAIDLTMIARQVAETSLIPAIVAIDVSTNTTTAFLPTAKQAEQWLGNPEDVIKCPTHSQRLIFGENRRQVPDLWNLERPLLLSPIHGQTSAAFTASRFPYYDNELPDILCSSQQAWRDQTRRAILLVSQNTNADTDIVYLCQGSTFVLASQIEGAKVIGIHCLRPFPTEELLAAIGTSRKAIVLSESTSQLCGEDPLSAEIKGVLASSTCEVATVKCIGATTDDIRALIETVESGSSLPSVIGVSFLCENSPYPKHSSAMDELERSYPEIKSLSLFCASTEGKNAPAEQSRRSPLLESNLWDDPIGSLPRFWDQVGMLCQNSDEDLVTATPILSSNAIPPLTASLRIVESDSSVLPIFDPSSCDGDPTLWMTCPDGSISALVLSSKAILEAGIMQAGGNAAALRSIAGGLCKQMVAIAKTNMQPTVGELVACAFDALTVTEDRRDALQEALSAVIRKIGEVPISKTPLFFDKDGANEFLILSVNPDACKSPELIIAATAGHGIEPISRTPESVCKARSLQELILKLPDTSGETIQRISQVDGMKLPAIMLSRHCHFAMSAGDAAEAGSGSKLVLRQTLALAEYQLQPRLQEMLNQVETLAIELQEGATKLLAEAIPSGNLEAIAKAIEKSGQDEVELATILNSITGDDDAPRVDGEAVRMMSSLAEKLKNITIRLTQSSGGLGRARSGMTLTGTATSSWSAVFPWNPFSTPVAVDITNTGCSLAAGLFEGQMQQVLADLNIIRRARLVLENPIKAAHPVEEVDALSIQDLSDSERALCPPMFVIADSASLHRNALSELAWILGSDLPIKIIVLGDGTHDVALFGLTSCNAYIAQCSPSHPDQFATAMQEALQFSGPALVSIYKPCPKQHGFAAQDLIAQAALAVETRVCPLFSYNPNSEGIFGRCIDITANPTFEAVLVSDDLVPSAWAATQQRFVDGYFEEEAVIARWQMLQELSGVVTPFDAVARSQQEEAANQHKIDLDSQAKHYEEKIASLRDQYHAEAVASVTSGLISMASQASKPEVNN